MPERGQRPVMATPLDQILRVSGKLRATHYHKGLPLPHLRNQFFWSQTSLRAGARLYGLVVGSTGRDRVLRSPLPRQRFFVAVRVCPYEMQTRRLRLEAVTLSPLPWDNRRVTIDVENCSSGAGFWPDLRKY
jgi:hypothetical protein